MRPAKSKPELKVISISSEEDDCLRRDLAWYSFFQSGTALSSSSSAYSGYLCLSSSSDNPSLSMYSDQSTWSIYFSVIFPQFFFFSPAMVFSSGSYQVRFTLLCPIARLIVCLISTLLGSSSQKSVASWGNSRSSGMNLRSIWPAFSNSRLSQVL